MNGCRDLTSSQKMQDATSFDAFLKEKMGHPWLFQHTTRDMPFLDLSRALKEGAVIDIIDGSHNNDWGAAWRIILHTHEDCQWWRLYITPGRKEDRSAFHSELGGLYVMIVNISLLCSFYHIDKGSIEFGSDCEGALYYISTPDLLIPPMTHSFDIIMSVRKVHF
jgi:hypothetical protein